MIITKTEFKQERNNHPKSVFERKKHIKKRFSVFVIGQRLVENKYVFHNVTVDIF